MTNDGRRPSAQRGRVRVYIASSLDGFIAGPDDDLSFLDAADTDPAQVPAGALGYEEFIREVGALLMGRRTYDVVRGFGVPWPDGDRPVLVVTHRPLDEDPPATVRPVAGEIGSLVAEALEAAAGKDVYIDGGTLIRQAAEADLIDDLTITFAPIALGEGHPLFAGLVRPYRMRIVAMHPHPGGMMQIRAEPAR